MKYNTITFPTATSQGLSSKVAVMNHRPMDAVKFVRLARDKIHRLEKSSRVSSIEVRNGVVWLTGTPAKGDVLLAAGDNFQLEEDWPFVIQALEEAEIVFSRKG